MTRRLFRAVPLALIVLALAATVWWDQSGQDRFRLARVGVSSQSETLTTYSDADGPGPLPNGLERIEGSLVVDLKDEASSTEIVDFEQRHEVDLKYNSEHSVRAGLTVTDVSESRLPALLTELSQDPLVQHVEPNYMYYALAFPDDPMFGQQWHMTQVKCLEAWPWSNGQNAVVAVLDTGVAYANWQDFHQLEDLDKTRFVPGYDFVNKREQALDDHAHGSHVAGTIAQSTNNGKGVVGLAWGAAIMPVKVLSKSGSGSVANIADAINWAGDHGASAINMSLGGPFPSTVMDEACSYAKRQGTAVVCAAGNESKNRNGYPAGYSACISVSAVDRDENLTWYSNHGPDIDIAAPGGSTRNDATGGVLQNTIEVQNHKKSGYFYFQGTSMACPHAAAEVALLASLGVTNPSAVEAMMKSTARSKGKDGQQKGYGAGIMDAKNAVWRAGFVYGACRLALAFLLGAFVLMPLVRRGAFLSGMAVLPGLVMGSSGLFFLPLLMHNQVPLHPILTSGFPQWDMLLLGAAGHANPIFYSCLIPMALAVLVVENRFLRAIAAGLTAGIAAHLLFGAVTGAASVLYIPAILSRLWLLANGCLCIFLAVVLAEDQP